MNILSLREKYHLKTDTETSQFSTVVKALSRNDFNSFSNLIREISFIISIVLMLKLRIPKLRSYVQCFTAGRR